MTVTQVPADCARPRPCGGARRRPRCCVSPPTTTSYAALGRSHAPARTWRRHRRTSAPCTGCCARGRARPRPKHAGLGAHRARTQAAQLGRRGLVGARRTRRSSAARSQTGTTGDDVLARLHAVRVLRAAPRRGRGLRPEHAAHQRGRAAAVAEAYDFSGSRLVTSAAATARCWPRCCSAPGLLGVLFDLAPDRSTTPSPSSQVADRCESSAATSSSGAARRDAYLLSHVVHDWAEDRGPDDPAHVREAIGPAGGSSSSRWSCRRRHAAPGGAGHGDAPASPAAWSAPRTSTPSSSRAPGSASTGCPDPSPVSVLEAVPS